MGRWVPCKSHIGYVDPVNWGMLVHKMLLILISASHHSDFSIMPEFTIKSCIHGYHVRIWSNFDSNIMLCKHEIGNVVDQYAVAARTLVVYFCFHLAKVNMVIKQITAMLYIPYGRLMLRSMNWCVKTSWQFIYDIKRNHVNRDSSLRNV